MTYELQLEKCFKNNITEGGRKFFQCVFLLIQKQTLLWCQVSARAIGPGPGAQNKTSLASALTLLKTNILSSYHFTSR